MKQPLHTTVRWPHSAAPGWRHPPLFDPRATSHLPPPPAPSKQDPHRPPLGCQPPRRATPKVGSNRWKVAHGPSHRTTANHGGFGGWGRQGEEKSRPLGGTLFQTASSPTHWDGGGAPMLGGCPPADAPLDSVPCRLSKRRRAACGSPSPDGPAHNLSGGPIGSLAPPPLASRLLTRRLPSPLTPSPPPHPERCGVAGGEWRRGKGQASLDASGGVWLNGQGGWKMADRPLPLGSGPILARHGGGPGRAALRQESLPPMVPSVPSQWGRSQWRLHARPPAPQPTTAGGTDVPWPHVGPSLWGGGAEPHQG